MQEKFRHEQGGWSTLRGRIGLILVILLSAKMWDIALIFVNR